MGGAVDWTVYSNYPPQAVMTISRERSISDKISILIVDDHPLFRDGLHKALVLEDDLLVVGEAADGEQALEAVAHYHPAVVLLDINLPTINGLQVARQIKADHPNVSIVFLTAYHDSQQVLHAMRAGGSAYCPKDIMPDELIEVVREVARGLYIIGTLRMTAADAQTWINANVEALSRPYVVDADEHYIPLSARELEILESVTNGMSNKEIANRLNISQQTVKNHMTSILKKLNVQDRTQAAVTALRHGWVRINNQG